MLSCPHCHDRVAVSSNGRCPNCYATINQIVESPSLAAEEPRDSEGFVPFVPYVPAGAETGSLNPFEPPSVLDDLPQQSLIEELIWLYFSFRGRVTLGMFWLSGISVLVLIIVGTAVALELFGIDGEPPPAVALFFQVILVWSFFALVVKRWHDRDKSGWWTLIYFVPFVGPLWFFAELGLIPGTKGANRFGPAKRKRKSSRPDEALPGGAAWPSSSADQMDA